MDGASKEVSEKQLDHAFSSWALVIFLAIALTLLVIGVAIGLIAKLNSNSAAHQRRQRAAAVAAAASANRHSAQIASKMNGESGMYNNVADDTLLNQAFHSPPGGHDRSPDVIPHFNNGGK